MTDDGTRFLELARGLAGTNPLAAGAFAVLELVLAEAAKAFAAEIREVRVSAPGLVFEDLRTEDIRTNPTATEGK